MVSVLGLVLGYLVIFTDFLGLEKNLALILGALLMSSGLGAIVILNSTFQRQRNGDSWIMKVSLKKIDFDNVLGSIERAIGNAGMKYKKRIERFTKDGDGNESVIFYDIKRRPLLYISISKRKKISGFSAYIFISPVTEENLEYAKSLAHSISYEINESAPKTV